MPKSPHSRLASAAAISVIAAGGWLATATADASTAPEATSTTVSTSAGAAQDERRQLVDVVIETTAAVSLPVDRACVEGVVAALGDGDVTRLLGALRVTVAAEIDPVESLPMDVSAQVENVDSVAAVSVSSDPAGVDSTTFFRSIIECAVSSADPALVEQALTSVQRAFGDTLDPACATKVLSTLPNEVLQAIIDAGPDVDLFAAEFPADVIVRLGSLSACADVPSITPAGP